MTAYIFCCICVLFEIGIWELELVTELETESQNLFYLLTCNKAKAASFDPTAAWGTTGEAEEQVPVHNIK